jgi:hypothetical protein
MDGVGSGGWNVGCWGGGWCVVCLVGLVVRWGVGVGVWVCA